MSTLKYTDVATIPGIVQELRKSFNTGKTRDLAWRRSQLNALRKWHLDNKSKMTDALSSDLRMKGLLVATEFQIGVTEIDIALEHLEEWVKPENRGAPIVMQPAKALIHHDPLGVVLIIAPWNYPISLVTRPLAAAIAAGNCVVIKPSELAPACGALMESLTQYLDPKFFRVINGAVTETTELLKQKFDHILYTGNGAVGRIVMTAAAKHLTPVTLELGGKSPCIVDKETDVKVAASRICWGKYNNAGQTCIAPDYLLLHRSIKDEFISEFTKNIKTFYGEDPFKSNDFSAIISTRHAERLQKMLKDEKTGKLIVGGTADPANRYVAPTVVLEPDIDGPLMSEEIFGPILPIILIDSIDEAIDFVNKREKPLAAYVFTKNSNTANRVVNEAYYGNGAVNECILQITCPSLPFGGVGPSGMGAYGSEFGFQIFSHKKAVLYKSQMADPSFRFPPYTEKSIGWIVWLGGLRAPSLKQVATISLPFVAAGLYYYRERLTHYFE